LFVVHLEASQLTQHCSDSRRRNSLPHIRRDLSLRRAFYFCRRILDTHQSCRGAVSQFTSTFRLGYNGTPAPCLYWQNVIGFGDGGLILSVFHISYHRHRHAYNRTIITIFFQTFCFVLVVLHAHSNFYLVSCSSELYSPPTANQNSRKTSGSRVYLIPHSRRWHVETGNNTSSSGLLVAQFVVS
jgi:hypothetical protein